MFRGIREIFNIFYICTGIDSYVLLSAYAEDPAFRPQNMQEIRSCSTEGGLIAERGIKFLEES
jgi:hypothetical protein